jgi:hypothetical protein
MRIRFAHNPADKLRGTSDLKEMLINNVRQLGE